MLAVTDLARARRFYEDVLGLEPLPGLENEVARYRAGTSVFVVYRSEYAGTNKATALTWTVGDELDRKVSALKAKGVKFELYDLPDTERQGEIHVSGEIRNAWFKDPDGNIHALSSK
jgi:catechol 2,3-dioxygenase-like lactoylglutathione lyase family enzyme